MRKKRNKEKLYNNVPKDYFSDKEYDIKGPEDGKEWVRWVDKIVSDIKNGYEYERVYVFKKDVPEKNLVRIEEFEDTFFNGENEKTVKKFRGVFFMPGVKNEISFLAGCRKFFVISDKDCFLRVYYK